MKKLITLTVALFVIGVGNLFAQSNTDNDAVTVTANVVSAISITAPNDLEFGDVSQGTTPEVNANNSADAAQVNITGAADEEFSITFSAIDLVGPTPTDLIPFTPSLVGAGAVGDKGTAAPIASTDNRELTASGEYFLWLGGTLTVGATQAPGSYTGDITITVAYTSL